MSDRIALVAKRKSGKSTVAEMLTRSYGYKRIALAGPLKCSAVEMLNHWLAGQGETRAITLAEMDEHKAAFRPLLEWLGTPFGRDYLGTPERWLDQFELGLMAAERLGHRRFVVDDVRQPNEAERLRAMGFVIVRVMRPEHERHLALEAAGEIAGAMPSERYIDQIAPDAELRNVDTLDYLAGQVCAMVDWAREVSAA
jgi:hypothetical protein